MKHFYLRKKPRRNIDFPNVYKFEPRQCPILVMVSTGAEGTSAPALFFVMLSEA
jgi:hypothetical protein